MASRFSCTRMADASAAAGTAKTMLRILAGSNDPITVIAWWVWFDSVASSDKPIKIELLQETTAGAPTGTAGTINPMGPSMGTAGAAALVNCSAEGSPTLITLEDHMIPATSGGYFQLPLGREYVVPAGQAFRIRVTAVTSTVNVAYGAAWEE